MLAVITGKQRAGKTYYCVTQIVEYLKNSSRPIFTNLPLNPDILCNYASGGKLKYPARYEAYLDRICLFKSFNTRKKRVEYPFFKKSNPDYLKAHKEALRRDRRLLYEQDLIKVFWKVTEPNSVIFLDELYQWFNAMDQFSQGVHEMRKELLTYTRQHGHYKDDMFLVSHNQQDLDVHIRRGIQRQYIVQNSKYTNMFQNRFMRGLKYPIQFFIISAFEYGETEISDRYFLFPEKIIYKCYESFSIAETLNKRKVSDHASNTDSGTDLKGNIKNFFRQFFPYFMFFVISIVCIVVGFRVISKNFLVPKTVQMGNTVASTIPISDFYKVIFISPSQIIFDDGYKLEQGGFIYGYKVLSFHRDYVTLLVNGDSCDVAYTGLRIRERTDKTGHNEGSGQSSQSAN